MPHRFAGAEAADRLAILLHIGHDIDLGQAFDKAAAGFLHRSPIEIAESAAEGDEILVVEGLAAEQDHLMLVPGAPQRRKLPVVERCEVDAPHLGAKRRAGWNNIKRTDGRVARNLAFDIHFNRPPGTIDEFRLSPGRQLRQDNYRLSARSKSDGGRRQSCS